MFLFLAGAIVASSFCPSVQFVRLGFDVVCANGSNRESLYSYQASKQPAVSRWLLSSWIQRQMDDSAGSVAAAARGVSRQTRGNKRWTTRSNAVVSRSPSYGRVFGIECNAIRLLVARNPNPSESVLTSSPGRHEASQVSYLVLTRRSLVISPIARPCSESVCFSFTRNQQ